MEGSPYMGKPAKIWVPHSSDNARVASRASFRPYQITFQVSFGLYQITFQDFFELYQITFQASFGLFQLTFQSTYYIPPGDCRRRTAWLIFFILKKTHPSWLFMSMSWIGKNLQLAHLETQLASLRC